MFQFPPFASLHKVMIITLQVIGLSHSDIPGSQIICIYTGLFAAYHVLHRLREPRHPPCALDYFRLMRNLIPRSYFQLLIISILIYSLACVNMSKISSRLEFPLIGCADQHSHGKVENNGFEPLTPCLQSRCSSQLS